MAPQSDAYRSQLLQLRIAIAALKNESVP